jgi:hypothetical protein
MLNYYFVLYNKYLYIYYIVLLYCFILEMNFLAPQNSVKPVVSYASYIPYGLIILVVFIVIIVFAASNYGKKVFGTEKDYIYKNELFTNLLESTNTSNESNYVEMLTPSEVGKYITNNFTLTMFLNMNSIGLQTSNNVPLVNLVGFGTIILNPSTNVLSLMVGGLSDRTFLTSITIPDFTPTAWFQLGIVCEGRTIKIYRNGMFMNSTLLPSLPLSKPQGVLYNKGSSIPGTVGYIHAYARSLDSVDMLNDYMYIVPTGSTVPQPYTFAPSLSVDDLTSTFSDLMCKIGICAPKDGSDDLRIGPVDYVNYEYA